MLAAFHQHLVDVPFLQPHSGHTSSSRNATAECVETLAASHGMTIGRRVTLDAGGIALLDGLSQLAEAELPSSSVKVIFRGSITNVEEVCSLYNIDSNSAPNEAKLLLSLYLKGFSDVYGDYTDQPATLLGCLEGDFACMLYDSAMGYLLAVRSPSGGIPLYWGTDMQHGDNLVISTVPGHLSVFPPGIAFESQKASDTEGKSRIFNFMGHTPAARRVHMMSKTDSHGHLCGLMLKSKSGRDLVGAAPGTPYRDVF